MKILVTGGAGFIGSHIVDAYLSKGHEVAVVDTLPVKNIKNSHPNLRSYMCDIRDAQLDQIFAKEKPDIVNHHAAQINAEASVKDPFTDYSTNVYGLLNLLECCRKHGVKKIIFASSAAVYGDKNEKHLPLKEEDVDFQLTPYGTSKRSGELYLMTYAYLYNIPFVILRYSNVYGPRQRGGEGGVVAVFISNLLSQQSCTIFGDGKDTRDYIVAHDVAAANVLALEKGENCTLNISTGKRTTVNELFNTLKELHKKGEGTVINASQRSGDIHHSALSPAAAKKVLGWEPKASLATGLQETYQWFAEERP